MLRLQVIGIRDMIVLVFLCAPVP